MLVMLTVARAAPETKVMLSCGHVELRTEINGVLFILAELR